MAAFVLAGTDPLLDSPPCLLCGAAIDPGGELDYRGAVMGGNAVAMFRDDGEKIGYICPECFGPKEGFEGRLREGLRHGARRLRNLADELEGWSDAPSPDDLTRRRGAGQRGMRDRWGL